MTDDTIQQQNQTTQIFPPDTPATTPQTQSVDDNPESKEVPQAPEGDSKVVAALKAISTKAEEDYEATHELIEEAEELLVEEDTKPVTEPAHQPPNH